MGGSRNGEVSKHQETLSPVGSFGISEGNITGRKKLKKKKPTTMGLTTTPSREVAQMLASASSEWELNREAWAACLG